MRGLKPEKEIPLCDSLLSLRLLCGTRKFISRRAAEGKEKYNWILDDEFFYAPSERSVVNKFDFMTLRETFASIAVKNNDLTQRRGAKREKVENE
jgi:hypothetical protein